MRILMICFLLLSSAVHAKSLRPILSGVRTPAPTLDRTKIHKAFINAGLLCEALSGQGGTQCHGKMSTYPEEINIFIPAHFKPQVDLEIVLYLHGHLGYRPDEDRISTYDDILKDTNFAGLFSETHRNALLVVPASQGRCDTFKSQFATAEGFYRFLTAIVDLGPKASLSGFARLSNFTLIGHSGAYAPIADILDHSGAEVDETYLLDALYAKAETFQKYANLSGKKFVSVFIPNSPTSPENYRLWQLLDPDHKGQSEDRFYEDCFESDYFEDPATSDRVKQAKFAFIKSDVSHQPTLNKYFAKLLSQ